MLNTHYIKIKIDYINIVWHYKREINVKKGWKDETFKEIKSEYRFFTVNILY